MEVQEELDKKMCIRDRPYGGCGVLASALCMDKKIFKDIMRQRRIPVCKDICINAYDLSLIHISPNGDKYSAI